MPIKPTIGRIVHCYSPTAWNGPRPGIIANCWANSDLANVNVFLDGANDANALAGFRDSPHGNTLMSVEVLDPQTDEQRAVRAAAGEVWCEWMPFQMGQAAKTDELKPAVTQLQERVELAGNNITLLQDNLQQLRDDFTAAVAAKSNILERLKVAEDYLIADRLDGKAKEVSQTFNTGLADRVKDAVLHLAEVLAKPQSPGHPRQNLFSQCARIIDGKPFSGEPAEPVPHTPPEA